MRLIASMLLPLVFSLALSASAWAAQEESVWATRNDAGAIQLQVYLFWSPQCPHCVRARAFLRDYVEQHSSVQLKAHDVTRPEGARAYRAMAATLDESARSVPAIAFCGQMTSGFHNAETTGQWLTGQFERCLRGLQGNDRWQVQESVAPVHVPGLGALDPEQLSLPVLTLSLGLLDSINPCAFFVLLFLLSLLVHLRSRARMLLVGGTFVVVSGVVYFLVMAAWLNLFLVLTHVAWITTAAGIVAILLASLNLKDAVAPGHGPSASIPESAKPSLFRRMRRLLNADNLPALMGGTLVLAISANTYELLCTAGFPMVYTRVLSLADLSSAGYYAYLALYNLIYILPLLAIVILFVVTLGARKLTERGGRLLKFLSGAMMLALGAVLLSHPGALADLRVAVGVPIMALVATGIYARWFLNLQERHR